ncbi:hypothetical protein GSI_12299 [Ganoderma sinense ZZ0214-1]|uniref:Uncharacterized protein n=1 Tax=Ganoderma sinense ZZ0214-1 TaxID=1077348 RepID=A0A2G8RYE7_9APHY|nr:hypothetical protein GSI_12299 [Ganoderma sinense ZZ0214-1]
MLNVTVASEIVQSTDDGWMFTEHDILLSRSVSLVAQSILFVAFGATYHMARSTLLKRLASGSLQRGSLIHLTALMTMFFLALANVLMSVLDSRPTAGYAGKLDTAYKTFDDEYFLFMSVRGVQFYLFMAQTMVANTLMIYTFYAKSEGHPKAGSYAVMFSILGNIFGLCAFANSLWAFEFLFLSAAISLLTSSLVSLMRAALRDSDTACRGPRAAVHFLFSRKFYDAVVQSAVLYRVASLSLLVTFALDPNVLFYPTISILSPLMGIAFSLAAMSKYRSSSDSDGAIHLQEAQLVAAEEALVEKEEAAEA